MRLTYFKEQGELHSGPCCHLLLTDWYHWLSHREATKSWPAPRYGDQGVNNLYLREQGELPTGPLLTTNGIQILLSWGYDQVMTRPGFDMRYGERGHNNLYLREQGELLSGPLLTHQSLPPDVHMTFLQSVQRNNCKKSWRMSLWGMKRDMTS